MFIFSALLASALTVIPLEGVVGNRLSSRVEFDAYNVNVGDPMILTVDFIGEADFGALHPPELSGFVDSSVWKVDDKSAKTDTYRDARRIIYRVRPIKEGNIEFPSLTFSYKHHLTGETLEVSTLAMPVHSKKSSQVALSGLDDMNVSLPLPDGIIVDLSKSQWNSQSAIGEDELFSWRRACSLAKAEEFKKFNFPEARLNEAACEILAGNWARALSIYSSLEWKIGQTPTIERGIIAAIALKTSNPDAELPMWRRVMRPVLIHSWKGRALYTLGASLAVAAVFFILKMILRIVVCFAVVVLLTQSAFAIDPFAELDRMHEEMMRRMNSMMSSPGGGMMSSPGGGFRKLIVNGVEIKPPKVIAKVSSDKTELTVGENFNLLVSLEVPKDCSLPNIEVQPSRLLGLKVLGKFEMLPDEAGSLTNSVVKRMIAPLRYDIPFKENVTFSVRGSYKRIVKVDGVRSFLDRDDFLVEAGSLSFNVKLLDGVKTPDDYNGCIGEGFTAHQRLNSYEVETNDVVVAMITVRGSNAFIPENAFVNEQGRDRNTVIYKKLFRATGESKTPDISFSYYSPTKKDFSRVTAKGVPLKYITSKERDAKAIVIDAAKGATKTVLKFAPRESAREIATTSKGGDELKITETNGEWVRVDDGMHAGWVKKKDLK